MPAYHSYLGYRLDAPRALPATRRKLRDELRSILAEHHGGDEWLEGRFQVLADLGGDVRIDLMVATWEHEEFALWTLVNHTVFVRPVLSTDDGSLELEAAEIQSAFFDREKQEDPDPDVAAEAYAAVGEEALAAIVTKLFEETSEEVGVGEGEQGSHRACSMQSPPAYAGHRECGRSRPPTSALAAFPSASLLLEHLVAHVLAIATETALLLVEAKGLGTAFTPGVRPALSADKASIAGNVKRLCIAARTGPDGMLSAVAHVVGLVSEQSSHRAWDYLGQVTLRAARLAGEGR